jgi:predicted nucleotidyltransferase
MTPSNRPTDAATPYTVEKIREIVSPIARRFDVQRMWLFGSYARGDFDLDSDLDFRVDMDKECGFFKLGSFYAELEEALGMKIDLLTTGGMNDEFLKQVANDEIIIYKI